MSKHNFRFGPILGFVTLLTVAFLGVVSSPPMTIPNPGQSTNQRHITKASEDNRPSFFFAVGAWARDNREAIDPLAAIGGLVIASAVAYATFFLYAATKALAATTDELAKAAHEQSTEMALARDLTERTITLEEKQFLLAGRQTELAENLYGLQREQYLAEHRPRIKIRSIAVKPAGARSMFRLGHAIEGSLVLVNIGASEAIIRQADYRFFWGHVMGTVRFSDWNLQDRMMGFCQKFLGVENRSDGSFMPVDNPDYEYED